MNSGRDEYVERCAAAFKRNYLRLGLNAEDLGRTFVADSYVEYKILGHAESARKYTVLCEDTEQLNRLRFNHQEVKRHLNEDKIIPVVDKTSADANDEHLFNLYCGYYGFETRDLWHRFVSNHEAYDITGLNLRSSTYNISCRRLRGGLSYNFAPSLIHKLFDKKEYRSRSESDAIIKKNQPERQSDLYSMRVPVIEANNVSSHYDEASIVLESLPEKELLVNTIGSAIPYKIGSSDFGRTIVHKNERYEITGVAPEFLTFQVVCRRIRDGKEFRLRNECVVHLTGVEYFEEYFNEDNIHLVEVVQKKSVSSVSNRTPAPTAQLPVLIVPIAPPNNDRPKYNVPKKHRNPPNYKVLFWIAFMVAIILLIVLIYLTH